jgi:hypothetical protein
MKLEHTYLKTMVTGFAEIEDKVFLCLSHAPNLGFSMGQTTNEQNSQSDGKGDLASLFITVQP